MVVWSTRSNLIPRLLEGDANNVMEEGVLSGLRQQHSVQE